VAPNGTCDWRSDVPRKLEIDHQQVSRVQRTEWGVGQLAVVLHSGSDR
jgi:hypothetical protein